MFFFFIVISFVKHGDAFIHVARLDLKSPSPYSQTKNLLEEVSSLALPMEKEGKEFIPFTRWATNNRRTVRSPDCGKDLDSSLQIFLQHHTKDLLRTARAPGSLRGRVTIIAAIQHII